jgi:hypothetical protein
MKCFINIVGFVYAIGIAALFGKSDASSVYIPGTFGYSFSQGLARIFDSRYSAYPPNKEREFHGKFGYIDRAGRLVIPFLYDSAGDFSQGLAFVAVWKENSLKYGYVNLDGKMILPLSYDDARSFSEAVAPVKINDKWGYIDTNGKIVVEPRYFEASSFSDGLAYVQTKQREWGYIDRKGDVVIQVPNGLRWDFSEGLTVGPELESTMMDHKGKIHLTFDRAFQPVKSFSEGLITISRGASSKKVIQTLYGFGSASGEVVIPCIYQIVFPFSEGLAAVSKDGSKFGFIDTNGHLVLPYIYTAERFMDSDQQIIFSEGLAFVQGGYINRRGDWVFRILEPIAPLEK